MQNRQEKGQSRLLMHFDFAQIYSIYKPGKHGKQISYSIGVWGGVGQITPEGQAFAAFRLLSVRE